MKDSTEMMGIKGLSPALVQQRTSPKTTQEMNKHDRWRRLLPDRYGRRVFRVTLMLTISAEAKATSASVVAVATPQILE